LRDAQDGLTQLGHSAMEPGRTHIGRSDCGRWRATRPKAHSGGSTACRRRIVISASSVDGNPASSRILWKLSLAKRVLSSSSDSHADEKQRVVTDGTMVTQLSRRSTCCHNRLVRAVICPSQLFDVAAEPCDQECMHLRPPEIGPADIARIGAFTTSCECLRVRADSAYDGSVCSSHTHTRQCSPDWIRLRPMGSSLSSA
jgi:hypothetical protein